MERTSQATSEDGQKRQNKLAHLPYEEILKIAYHGIPALELLVEGKTWKEIEEPLPDIKSFRVSVPVTLQFTPNFHPVQTISKVWTNAPCQFSHVASLKNDTSIGIMRFYPKEHQMVIVPWAFKGNRPSIPFLIGESYHLMLTTKRGSNAATMLNDILLVCLYNKYKATH